MHTLDSLVGHPAPDFTLQARGRTYTLPQLLASQGLLLAFIHGTWCPACVDQLIRLRRRHRDYMNLNVQLAAIVGDQVAAVEAFEISAEPPLPFPLLADTDLTVSQTYGLTAPAEQTLLTKLAHRIRRSEPQRPEPVEGIHPGAVLVDGQGHVRLVNVPDDPHAPIPHERLLAAIRSWAGSD